MQELSDRTIAEVADVHFDIPEPIRTLECRIAPTKDGGIYYTAQVRISPGPAACGGRPEGVADFSTWKETTTVFHEGVPGHHLQVAQAVYRREVLNRWQRLLCWVSGHGEGWALYAERLMADLGFLDDPGDRLGMLDAQAFRAARVVVDIGIHLELDVPDQLVAQDALAPGRWTPESAHTFLRRHTRLPEENLSFELDRYLGWPGQAPSYKVGERIWLTARDDVRRRKGDAFDLKEFHRGRARSRCPRSGPAPGRPGPAVTETRLLLASASCPAPHPARSRHRAGGQAVGCRRTFRTGLPPSRARRTVAAGGSTGTGARKAEAVAAGVVGLVVLGCDSVLELDGTGYGKPAGPDEAVQRWSRMRGRSGVLHTGHWVIDRRDSSSPSRAAVASTTVHFADITDPRSRHTLQPSRSTSPAPSPSTDSAAHSSNGSRVTRPMSSGCRLPCSGACWPTWASRGPHG